MDQLSRRVSRIFIDVAMDDDDEVTCVSNLKFSHLKHHVTCGICCGIIIDVCTIIECLHSFCRSCLVVHLQSRSNCPTCSCPLDNVSPLRDIKTDPKVQDVISALFPVTHDNEMNRRRDFYHEMGLHAAEDRVFIKSASASVNTKLQSCLQRKPYDAATRIPLLATRSNKVWLRLTAFTKLKHYASLRKVLYAFHSEPRFIRCAAYTTVYHIADQLTKRIWSKSKKPVIVRIFYADCELPTSISMREIFTQHHESKCFPISLSVAILPDPRKPSMFPSLIGERKSFDIDCASPKSTSPIDVNVLSPTPVESNTTGDTGSVTSGASSYKSCNSQIIDARPLSSPKNDEPMKCEYQENQPTMQFNRESPAVNRNLSVNIANSSINAVKSSTNAENFSVHPETLFINPENTSINSENPSTTEETLKEELSEEELKPEFIHSSETPLVISRYVIDSSIFSAMRSALAA